MTATENERRTIFSDMPITIRPALASDAHDIGRLAAEFAGYLRSLGDQSEFNPNAAAYLRDGFGQSPAFSGIVAEENGRVMGYLLYHFGYDSDAAERNLHVADIYVELQGRNRGAGTALMKAAAKITREANVPEMIWSVYQANGLAADFYQHLGAQRINDVFFMKLRADAL
jgi:hypothetical protein